MPDLNYYRVVADTQNDPEILKAELNDLISEIEAAKTSSHLGLICPGLLGDIGNCKVDEPLSILSDLGEVFQGVDLKFRRSGTEWEKKWKAECFSSKHESARHTAYGDSAEDAIYALVALVEKDMRVV